MERSISGPLKTKNKGQEEHKEKVSECRGQKRKKTVEAKMKGQRSSFPHRRTCEMLAKGPGSEKREGQVKSTQTPIGVNE